MDILSGLNTQQKQAVTTGADQVLVLAGPGSGKTRVLVQRIAFLINSGVQPKNILAVTFTNKAARELENRVSTQLGDNPQGLWVGTFHGICARILRREADHLTLPIGPDYVIMDADDQVTLVKRVIKELNIDDKRFRPAAIHDAISAAKNAMIDAQDYPSQNYKDEIVGRVYARYQALLIESNAVDFDDLLLLPVRLFSSSPMALARYANRFEHVLVDEFQDTNQVQYTLVKMLSSQHKRLFVVGDEDQSIYRWRGADYRNVLLFEKDFPKREKILLEQNYRSTQTVLDAARAVIDHNPNRTVKRLFTDRGDGEKVVLYEAGDDYAEAGYVVDTIQQLLNTKRAKPGDFAIMYRTNAQSRLLEEAFLHAGVPYRLVGAQRFYGRREIKDLIAFLRLAHNPADDISLTRVINIPPRGIGEKTLLNLQVQARQVGKSTGEMLIDLAKEADAAPHPVAMGRAAAALAEFGARLAAWRSMRDSLSLPELFERILDDTGYHDYVDDNTEEGEDRWDNVEELRRITIEYEDSGLIAFLDNIALVSDQDTIPETETAPTLLTLHAAKGLEFSHVFITGVDDGILPHSRSLDDPEEMAEERRLFYVGMTRAKDRLYLVRADQRAIHGLPEATIPSRFLKDVPEALLQAPRRRERSGGRGGSAAYTTWDQMTAPYPRAMKAAPAPAVQQRYKAGMRIRHPVWGEGIVLESRVQDDDELVDVAFETVGFKRLAGSIARLEIIK